MKMTLKYVKPDTSSYKQTSHKQYNISKQQSDLKNISIGPESEVDKSYDSNFLTQNYLLLIYKDAPFLSFFS